MFTLYCLGSVLSVKQRMRPRRLEIVNHGPGRRLNHLERKLEPLLNHGRQKLQVLGRRRRQRPQRRRLRKVNVRHRVVLDHQALRGSITTVEPPAKHGFKPTKPIQRSKRQIHILQPKRRVILASRVRFRQRPLARLVRRAQQRRKVHIAEPARLQQRAVLCQATQHRTDPLRRRPPLVLHRL